LRHRRVVAAVATALALVTGSVLATTPAAAAPVPTVAAAATAPDLTGLTVDEFGSPTLDSRWSITNESAANWSLSTDPGALTLTAQTGDTYQGVNTAKNVFMVDIPAGDFTAITKVSAPVTKVYQGAGLIAWSDMDNYVRSGLTYVGSLSASGIAIENDVETGAVFSAADFEDRPNSSAETLRLQRSGDTVTTSYYDDVAGAWVVSSSINVTFDITQIGVYAFAAQDGTTFPAAFDYFAFQAAQGADVVPAGSFTLHAVGTAEYLVVDDGTLAVSPDRPSSTVALTASAVAGRDGVVTLASGGAPLVVTDNALTLGAVGDTPTPVRITDAGGGKVTVRDADAVGDDGYVGVGAGGVLTLVARALAARFILETVEFAGDGILDIDGDQTSADVSPDLYGIFYEDINYAADGGLYAELVRNRSFEFNTSDNSSFTGMTGWQVANRGGASATATVETGTGILNQTNRFFLSLVASGPGAGVRNNGYNNGIALAGGGTYDFSVWARTAVAQDLTIQLENSDGGIVFGTATVAVDGSDTWKKYLVTLTATATTDSARLAVLAGAASTVRIDQVSLFPEDTWVGPVNGKSVLRKDLAEKIAALQPKFLRFPGGCVTNVGTFRSYVESNYADRRRTYQWKETVGPVEQRATNYNFWGYNQSYGIGYLEYLEFAEDLGAVPLPVLSVGANGCGSSVPEMKDDATIARWVQDTTDLIEFATGDTNTTWGAYRASLGHPKPFTLKWIGLGNEENTTTFEANFPKFRDAIKAKYPNIEIISNSGPDDTGSRFDTLWAYNRAQDVDLVDEHYYNDPNWFLTNNSRYDSYDRTGPKVFLGEYASQGNTQWNALTEASYMTGLERNSDVVELASYAPLLANESYVQWSPDAIWFDNDESWGSPNYYVQKMFSTNQGDQVVPSTYTGPATPETPISGGVFLSTWSTSARYDNVTVTSNDSGDTLFSDDFATGASKWAPQTGTWAASGGAYAQTSTSVTDARSIVTGAYTKDWKNYTLELDATKVAGAEGFLIGFGATATNNFFWWNVGGWGNTRSVLQKAAGGSANEVKALENQVLNTGQTYHYKVVVQGRTIKLYQDNVLQLEYTDTQATQAVFQDVTRDEATGDLVVKVVNTSNQIRRTAVSVADAGIEPTGTATVLAGRPTDTNTKADKTNVVPIDYPLTGLSSSFSYSFDPYSVTFLRLHTTDVAAPTIDSVALSPNSVRGWYPEPVTVTATASDDRGVVKLESQVDGGAWLTAPSTGTATVTVSGHGPHTVRFRATDAKGNISDTRETVFSIDTAPPVSNAVVDAQARTVTVRAADGGSGVARIEYRIGTSGAWSSYSTPIKVGAAATTVQYRGVDAFGNTETPGSVVVPKAGVDLKSSVTVATVTPSNTRYYVAAKVTVRVSGAGGTPTGRVRVLRGSEQVGVATLASGRATITLTRTIPPGSSTLTVSYAGDSAFAGSSDTVRLTVNKALSGTKVVVSPTKITTRTNPVITATVSSKAPLTGAVTVTVAKTSVPRGWTTTRVLPVARGKAALTLPKLPTGSYRVSVRYQGSSTVLASTASTTFVVTR